jgi:hypothetical protein
MSFFRNDIFFSFLMAAKYVSELLKFIYKDKNSKKDLGRCPGLFFLIIQFKI